MYKTILLTSVATALFVANAHATEITPSHYFSAKAAFARMINDVHAISDYSFSGSNHFVNTFAKQKHEDNVFGLRVATGTTKPLGNNQIRAEIELGWNSNAKDSNGYVFHVTNNYNQKFATKLSVYSAMINLYYDINTGTVFTPYIGGGFGYAYLKNKSKVTGMAGNTPLNQGSSEGDHNLAFNLGAGISYALTDRLTFDLGYRYSDYGKFKDRAIQSVPGLQRPIKVSGEYDVTAHEFLLGARYAF